MQRRWALIQELMDSQDLDVLLIYGAGRYQADVLWASDWPGGREAYVVIPRAGDPTLFLQFYNHLATARRLSRIRDVRWAGPVNPRTVGDRMAELAPLTRVGIAGPLPFDQYASLVERFSGTAFLPMRGPYQAIRLIKSEEEIERFRYACHLADLSMEALSQGLRPGLMADRLPALVEAPILEGGGYAGIHYFGVMPMDGPFLSAPAQYWDPQPLSSGDVVTTEITGCYGGYVGQVHRTYSVGREPDEAWRRLHANAQTAFHRLLDAVRPGARVEELMDAVEFLHREGCTVLDDLVHGADQLPPVLQSRTTMRQPYPEGMRLQPNMMLVLQPNVVDAEGRGLQFGETVRVLENGVERLHRVSEDWVTVPGA